MYGLPTIRHINTIAAKRGSVRDPNGTYEAFDDGRIVLKSPTQTKTKTLRKPKDVQEFLHAYHSAKNIDERNNAVAVWIS